MNKISKKVARIQEMRDWNDKLIEAIKDKLPHGSGIDCDWNIQLQKTNYARFVCKNSFHCMDEYGGYCHWQDFTVIVDWKWSKQTHTDHPEHSFVLDRLEFNGRLHACAWGLREYLYDTLVYSLESK